MFAFLKDGNVGVSQYVSHIMFHLTLYTTHLHIARIFLVMYWLYYVYEILYSYSNDSDPELTGPLAVNDHLKRGVRLFENDIIGPEALVMDKEGVL